MLLKFSPGGPVRSPKLPTVGFCKLDASGTCCGTVNTVQGQIVGKVPAGERSFLLFGKDDSDMEHIFYVLFVNILKDPQV